MLVERFGWSLSDIDATDMESLWRFMFHYQPWKNRSKAPQAQKRYIDEVDWL